MKAIPVLRGSGRPIALRVPSERRTSRLHQFRWWSLDIEPHREMISELRRLATPKRHDIKEQWTTYLKAINERGIVTALAAHAASAIWNAIARCLAAAVPPNARPTDDQGLRLSWNRAGRYIEILIAPDGSFEWFYTDTNNAYEGGEDFATGEPVDRLLARLGDVF